jgi:hypothetical protein
MSLDKMTIGEIKEMQSMFNTSACSKNHPYKIGGKYFIRTVTHHFTGKLTEVFKDELVLEDCAWIADDGRFSDALANKEFSEVEPYPDGPVIIGRGSIIDVYELGITPRSKK